MAACDLGVIGKLIERNQNRLRVYVANVGLAVSFQEVVHSALTGNSEVAKPPAIRGEPNGHP